MSESRLDAWMEGYLSYLLEVSGKSKGTVKDVRCTLKRVSRKMDDLRPDMSLWQLSLRDFLQWIEQEREGSASPQTLAKWLSHLRGMLDYAWRSGKSDRNVLDGFSLDDTPQHIKRPEVLTVAEAQCLVEHCPSHTACQRQERMMILLFYGCGLRTSELRQLKLQHPDHERKELFIERGKGDRQRVVPLSAVIYRELLAYLHDRGRKAGPLFRTDAKQRAMRNQQISEVVRQAALRAGLEKHVTPKVLRHSFATHLMARGVDLGVIASLMGHRSPAETGVYLHAFADEKQQAVDHLRRARSEDQEPQHPDLGGA